MRAARYDRYGPPEVLYEARVPRPVPGPGEVLVRVHASSVNGGEPLARAGRLRPLTDLLGRFPKGVGMDFAGEVAALGSPMRGLKVGDRVWGGGRGMSGAAAEYVLVRPRHLAFAPEGTDLVEAAALPGVGTTAITALRDKARLRAGERLLVRGASGGVGSVAVQLGRAYGARVTGLARAANLGFVEELGAHETADYATTGPADLGRFDVVLDTVGTDLPAYRRLLAPGGRLVTIAFDLGRPVRSLGYALGARGVRFFSADPTHRLFADLARLVERGAVRPVVDTAYELAGIAEAHRALESGGVRGKVVVRTV